MVKGGFQGLDISGVDLTAQSPTLPGAYATCAGADGKPIRVQTADGQVECSVKKVSTNYVLGGVTGDGKILSITIGSTDVISVSEAVPGEMGEVTLDEAIDITDLEKVGNYFKIPSDGYFKLTYSGNVAAGSHSLISAKRGSTSEFVMSLYSTGDLAANTLFVRKGMLITQTTPTNQTAATGKFVSLKES